MAGYFLTEHIARARDAVFAYCADLTNAATALDEVVEAKWLSDGPAVGARFQETRKENGKLSTLELTMEEYQPPERYAVTADVSNIRVSYVYTFRSEGDETRVSLDCTVEGRGLKRALAPVVAKVLQKKDGEQLQRLKQALEGA